MSARGGLKALFSGDSGTGKTLAAEVVAKELGLPLLKIDLARVVSKWVGETEKNLEAAFREAVAFALLGKLFLENRPGNVVTVTGARGPRILGKLTPASR